MSCLLLNISDGFMDLKKNFFFFTRACCCFLERDHSGKTKSC